MSVTTVGSTSDFRRGESLVRQSVRWNENRIIYKLNAPALIWPTHLDRGAVDRALSGFIVL